MKKLISALLLFFLTAAVAQAAITSVSQLSSTCLNDPTKCNAEENTFLDGQRATQNSGADNQGQAGQLINQGSNAANTATQYVSTIPSATAPASSADSGRLNYTPLEPLPLTKAGPYNGTLSQYLNIVFNILLSLGAMIAVVTLIIGGITYMVSEIIDKKSEAKKRMQAAIWGLLLLLSCWLILHEINPNLTDFKLLGIDSPSAQPNTSLVSDSTGRAVYAGDSTPAPSSADFTACEGAEVATGRHLAPNPKGGGYICQ